LRRATLRALLTGAAIAAAIGLSACNPSDIPTSGRANAPLSEKMLSLMVEKHMDKESPMLARIFKEEAELEIWKMNREGQYELLKTYPVCRWSGDLGPKKKEGDRQAPEGFYTITPGHMNPASSYYLAFNTGFPNAYDRAMGYTGSELMVHGDCSSRGCYAMTDEQIQEIYALARESFFGGQQAFQLQAFPFHMTALNMAKHRDNPNFAFWKMLKDGHDSFEATKQEPKVAVCEKHYVFDAAPADDGKPLKFNAAGKCPAYKLDPAVADVILDKRRSEQFQMAEYIGRAVATVPPRAGIDGGMHPAFASKLASHNEFDNNGRVYQVAGNTQAPGYLPRTPVAASAAPDGAQAQTPAQQQPVVVANVPMPPPAPLPKEGEAPPEPPKSIASLIGGIFATPQPVAQPAPVESDAVALRGSDQPTKPKRPAIIRTASAPGPTALSAKPHQPAPPAPKAVAEKPAPVQQAAAKPDAKPETQAEPQLRTAYSAPQSSSNGTLAGAQPVVPAGTFESRFGGFR